MKDGTLHISHDFGLTPDWQQVIVDALGNKLIDNKYVIHDGHSATGFSLFLEVMPGLSVLLMDMVYHIDVAFTRLANNDQFYLMYYDLCDEFCTHKVEGDDKKVRYSMKLGMGFMDSTMQSTVIPSPGDRYHSMRIFVTKALVKSLIWNFRSVDVMEEIFDEEKNTPFFYSHMDSASRLLLNELKGKDSTALSFELLVKGLALRVLVNTLRRARILEAPNYKMSSADTAGILMSAEHLLNDLLRAFPGLEVLAKMAGMSISKYKTLFSKIMKDSPQHFYMNKKMLLAKNLLQHGTFALVKDVAFEMGYTKPGHFAAAYRKAFGCLPGEDLHKKL